VFEPTYSLHTKIAQMTGTDVVTADRAADFRIDADAARRAIEESSPEIVMLCSPNNPTGNCDDPGVVETLLEAAPGLVIIDEAYVEFAGPARDFQSSLGARSNMVVVKTLSKAWRLAGVRIGYMLADPGITAEIARVRLPYHLSTFSQAMGVCALGRAGEALEHVRAITEERDRIGRGLGKLDVERFESHANFVLYRTPDAGRVWSALLEDGVLVRDYSATPGLRDCLRVTAGTPEETGAFLDATKRAIADA
jgi:histidinol-phosphate aminotransferase